MPYDLANLTLSEMTQLGPILRSIGSGANSTEEVAERVVRLLYDELFDRSTGTRACVLVRFYLTMSYASLDDELRAFGANLMQGQQLQPETRCLTLLATSGDRPEWNSRRQSLGHQAVPLPSETVLDRIPMISQLVKQMGLDVGSVIAPDPALVLELEQRTYNTFYVPEAVGSPYIPAQRDFAIPFGVRSVLGFGGLLPSGDVFAALMFTRVFIPRDTADLFRNAAMNLKIALLPFLGKPVFGHS